jgi:hypothetical protein
MKDYQNGEPSHKRTQLLRHLLHMKTNRLTQCRRLIRRQYHSVPLSVGAAQGLQGILALHSSAVRTEDATQNEQNARCEIGRGRTGGRRYGRGRFRRDRLGGGRIQGGGSGDGRNEGKNPEHNVVRFVALGMKLFNADIIQPAMKYALASTVSKICSHIITERGNCFDLKRIL